jgi:hypothetical protein
MQGNRTRVRHDRLDVTGRIIEPPIDADGPKLGHGPGNISAISAFIGVHRRLKIPLLAPYSTPKLHMR